MLKQQQSLKTFKTWRSTSTDPNQSYQYVAKQNVKDMAEQLGYIKRKK